ncbi:MAG: flagellar assembly protein FliW [Phycisphaeraceae bacterium]
MLLNTTRFGTLDVDEARIIEFPKGLLGFPRYKRFVLLEPNDGSYFWWLQAVDTPDLAFVVTDPSYFVSSYRVPLKADQMGELGIQTIEDAQVFVIVNKREHMLTGNLQGPLVVHVQSRMGAQLVLSDKRFTTRVPLVELPRPVQAMSA